MSRREGSIYDLAVLKLLHEHGAVPLQAVAHHLRGRHGKDESHMLQCVRQLEERGLLTRTPIGTNRGRASRLVLELTHAGYRWLGMPAMPNPYGRGGAHPRDYQIARAMAMLNYQARGCRIVQGPEVYEVLRSHAMATIRSGHDQAAKGLPLTLLSRAAGYDVRAEAVVAPDGAVALVLPVYQDRSWRAILDRLTMTRGAGGTLADDPTRRSALSQCAAIVPLKFVVLGAVPDEVKAAARGVERWARRHRLPAKTTTLPVWMVAGFPTEAHRPALKSLHRTPDAGRERQGSLEAAA